jgi:phosphoglycolate phosphatase
MAHPPTLVLDLDGTLVDTAGDLVATLNAIIGAQGLAPVPVDAAVTMVGHGARVMLERAFAAHGRTLTPESLDELTTRFIAHYVEHIAETSRPFPGAEAALDRFQAAGWRLAVCTNKLEGPARKLLGLLGLAGRFAAITGPDTFGFRKPDPRHLTETIRHAGGEPERAVMVGDSKIDVDAAKAAHVPIVAVTFGYSPEPIAELGAERLIDHFDRLWEAAAGLASP